MNKSELIKKLEKMPDDVPVWLGVDSGEGYSLLKDVFYGNSRHLPLDGDETSTYEWEDLEGGEMSPKDMVTGLVDDGTIYRPVIVLGAYGSAEEYLAQRQNFKDRDIIRLHKLKEELERLKREEEHIKTQIEKLQPK